MQYQIISTGSADSFEKQVNEALSTGWQLQGGVSVAVGSDDINGDIYYSQAMIKESK